MPVTTIWYACRLKEGAFNSRLLFFACTFLFVNIILEDGDGDRKIRVGVPFLRLLLLEI